MRGADVLVKALSAAGVRHIFSLSGNQILSVFDASIDTGIELIHVRHEAAAVHMADAWGRLTGQPGVALVTAGPGMANTLSALHVALMSESPLLLISGHAPQAHLGLGGFQEMAQVDMAANVAKASWLAADPGRLGADIARSLTVAASGRPGPVHISVPVDVMEASVDRAAPDGKLGDDEGQRADMGDAAAQSVLEALSASDRPLVLAGSAMMRGEAPDVLASLAEATGVPVASMESPRGIDDPSLGAFAEVLSEADMVLLLGKKLDFSLKMGHTPTFSPGCRFIQIDAEEPVLDQTRRVLGQSQLMAAIQAEPIASATRLTELSGELPPRSRGWYEEVQAAIAYRPTTWSEIEPAPDGPMHAVEVCREVEALLNGGHESVLISDGGEFGQWAQACVSADRRVINGPAGAIGASVPFAAAARLAFPDARIVAMVGDGAFGFHAMELDTAVRYGLPFVAVVGNDARWNAEYQLQLSTYGRDRLAGCELLPSRYDQVAEALGGHGENVSSGGDLRPALERSLTSGKPAVVSVAIHADAAPVFRRDTGESD